MNITLWVLQVLLATAFLAHGLLYLNPPSEMVEQMNAAVPPGFRIFIGVAEVLAAAGLILPGVTRILPGLVPAAAAGLAMVVASATVFHLLRGEFGPAAVTALLFVVSAFVAYMRWTMRPILPRQAARGIS
jgi:uncharacterized membrane protein YphA (DoxX/SURF4 family)